MNSESVSRKTVSESVRSARTRGAGSGCRWVRVGMGQGCWGCRGGRGCVWPSTSAEPDARPRTAHEATRGRDERFCRAAGCPPDLAHMLSRNLPMARGPHPPEPPLQSKKQSETRWDSAGVNSSEPCMDFLKKKNQVTKGSLQTLTCPGYPLKYTDYGNADTLTLLKKGSKYPRNYTVS